MRTVNRHDEAARLSPSATISNMDSLMGFGTLQDDGRTAADIATGKTRVSVSNPAMRAAAANGHNVQVTDPVHLDVQKADVLVRSGNQVAAETDPSASSFIWGYLGTNDAPVTPAEAAPAKKFINPYGKIPKPVLIGTGLLVAVLILGK